MYQLLIIGALGDTRKVAVTEAVSLKAIELDVTIDISDDFLLSSAGNMSNKCRQVVVYLGSEQALKDEKCKEKIAFAFTKNLQIIPVVTAYDEAIRCQQIPSEISNILSVLWEKGTQEVPIPLVTTIFESLSILEKNRKVFISYRQTDATDVAVHLHDELVKKRFRVFLDSFQVVPSQNIQDEISKALEETAFVLLLYSPEMYESHWIDVEITQALASKLPILIVKWTNAKQDIPKVTKANFPTVYIDPNVDLVNENRKIATHKLKEILDMVEEEHYKGLFKRRKDAVKAVKEYAKEKNLEVEECPGWNLIITDTTKEQCKIVAITPRLSCSEDLYQLDNMQAYKVLAPYPSKILLQVATKRPSNHKKFLDWIINKRNLEVVHGVIYIDDYL